MRNMRNTRVKDIISAQCFFIFSFLYFYVQATDDAIVKNVEYDFRSKRFRTTSPALPIDYYEEEKDNNDSRKICHLPQREGLCTSFTKRYYYDDKEERCKKFTYGGCFGNENNFKTYRECKKRCKRNGKKNIKYTEPQRPRFCYAPAYQGNNCKACMLRFFYNKETDRCELFVFHGCRPKRNNFYTLPECQAVCKPGKAVDLEFENPRELEDERK